MTTEHRDKAQRFGERHRSGAAELGAPDAADAYAMAIGVKLAQ